MNRLAQLLLLFPILSVLWGCDQEPKEVTAVEFRQMLERNPESIRHTELVGVKDGNAILKVEEINVLNNSDWKTSYYFTTATDLPKAWLTEKMKNQ